LVFVLLVQLPTDVLAQQPPKGPQIGYLISGAPALWANRIDALRTGLRDLGYVEGKNVTLVLRSAETPDRLPEAAAELVRRNVDVIFATSSTEVEPHPLSARAYR
jgi:putative tryptophan/tyrosine transport system substrate-binding protein